jgi:hypothetical protein
MRDTVSPIIQMAMILAVVLWWRQPDRPELFPLRREKAPPDTAAPKLPVTEKAPTKAPPPQSSPPKAARSHPVMAVKELASRRKS